MSAVITVMLGFVREHTVESCTRLCALLCCLTGCAIGLATIGFARLNPSQAASITALTGLTSAFIAGGTVAILARTRKQRRGDDDPGHSERSEESAVVAPAGAQ